MRNPNIPIGARMNLPTRYTAGIKMKFVNFERTKTISSASVRTWEFRFVKYIPDKKSQTTEKAANHRGR
jgi:hypothetical protein